MVKTKKKTIRAPEPEVYHVEVITKARVVPVSSDEEDEEDNEPRTKKKRKGKSKSKPVARWEYYVKWAGYDSDSNSWEPEGNVAGCQRLLASFWDHIGTDNEDYPVGYIVEAREKWIRKEKAFFAREFNDAQEKLRTEREREEREQHRKTAPKKPKKSTEVDGVRVPISKTHAPVKQAQSNELTFLSEPLTTPSKSDDEDSDDQPLRTRLLSKRKRENTIGSPDSDIFSGAPINTPPHKAMKLDGATRINTNNEQNDLKQPGGDTADQWAASLFSDPPSPQGPTMIDAPQPLMVKSRSIPAKKTPTIPAKIPRRPTNPHTRLAEMPPQNIASGSGISTKQRLAQGALAPTIPKAIPLPAQKERPQLHPVKTNPGLMAINFKKKPPIPAENADDSVDRVVVDDARTPTTPRLLEDQDSTFTAWNAPISPKTRYNETSSGDSRMLHSEPRYTGSLTVVGASMPEMQQPPLKSSALTDAEIFLQSVMPPALAAPLAPAPEQNYEPVPPRVLMPKIFLPQHRIPKKWAWSGSVYIDTAGNSATLLCNVTLCDVTEPLPMGLRFNVALASLDHLEFLTFHDVVDLPVILRACKAIQQFARLTPQEDKDVENLQVLQTYMVKQQKIILVPVSLDNNVVAHLIILPPDSGLCERFKVPPSIYVPKPQLLASLVVMLVPWSLSPSQLSKNWRKVPNVYLPVDTDIEPMISDKTRWERSIRAKPLYHHALRILRFPLWLHKFMSEPVRDRGFGVWWDSGDGSKRKPATETVMLLSIMEQCRAKKPVNLADARVIFVHVGAIKTLHKLPGFLDLCSKSAHVQFYTYGTHESISPEFWGVREIYPCGGVVTFTPEAIVENPIGILHKINQIRSHPLWMCYILPSVLGMVAKRETDDPLTTFDCGDFPYCNLLNIINDGDLALLASPPLSRLSTTDSDPRHDWLHMFWTHRPQDPRSILQSCMEAFNLKYKNIELLHWESAIKKEISDDLSLMRQQPVIMEQYRRCVVITGKSGHVPMGDGFEWTTLLKFDFKDDFFPTQD